MRYSKPATTVDEQLRRLLDRGLDIPDIDHAKRCLEAIGYYRLSAYWLPYEEPSDRSRTRSKRFRVGARFDEVMASYVFDRKLRVMTMEAIERIEIHLRSRWTNRLTLAHGAHGYLDKNHFHNSGRHGDWLDRLHKSVRKSDELFIQHYRSHYSEPGMPPLWAATELMTLGELSIWIKETRDHSIKDGLARDLSIPNKHALGGIVQSLAYVRNICAHHGRLWNRRLVKRMPLVKKWRADFTIEHHSGQAHPANLVHNVLVVMLHLLRHQNTDTSFPSRLRELVETVSDEQRAAMGFEANWRLRAIWE